MPALTAAQINAILADRMRAYRNTTRSMNQNPSADKLSPDTTPLEATSVLNPFAGEAEAALAPFEDLLLAGSTLREALPRPSHARSSRSVVPFAAEADAALLPLETWMRGLGIETGKPSQPASGERRRVLLASVLTVGFALCFAKAVAP